MANGVKRAEKLVTKATTVFGSAVMQVTEANELLLDEVRSDDLAVAEKKAKIRSIEESIKETLTEREAKEKKILANKVLLEQLENFVPQT